MTDDDTSLDAALAALDAPPLDPVVARRVRAMAAAELAGSAPSPSLAPHLLLRGALVPTVLLVAAAVRTADSAIVAVETHAPHAAEDTPDRR